MTQETNPLLLVATNIDEVLDQLDYIIDQSVADDNYLCTFAYVYRKTTFEVKKAIENDEFENAVRMEKMDVVFANYYIQAYKDFFSQKDVSKSWQFAFNLRNSKLSLIQHIMLGMNAHINLDLAVSAAAVSDSKSILDLKNDFMVINDILARLTNKMQKGLGRTSFLMKLLDFFGFRKDEKIINFSIRKARDFAWLNAVELALMNKSQKMARVAEIDKRVLGLSKIIKNPPGKLLDVLLRIIAAFEKKDKRKIVDSMRRD